jgi:hypothetical protein
VYGWSDSTTEAEREADTKIWRWEHLRCPAGHVIRQPSW